MFLSEKNSIYLLNTLKNVLKKKYNFDISDDEEHLLYTIMEMYKKSDKNLNELNKLVLQETIKIILKNLKKKINFNKNHLHNDIPETPEQIREHIEERNKIACIKTQYLTVDSRQRNINFYPNTFNYSLNINPFLNIISIELISAEIPKSEYIINNSNNKIYFQELITQQLNNTFNIANVPYGTYSLSNLKNIIETTMNNSSITNAIYNVDITTFEAQNKINISSDMGGSTELFNLIFYGGEDNYETSTIKVYTENSIGPLLGFSISNFTGDSNYTSNQQIDLDGENYIFLQINNFKTIENSSTSVKNIFAKISLDTNNDIKYFKNNDEYRVIKKFNPPLLRLEKIDISFLKYDGNFYNFNGKEHSLLFKIETLNYKN